jgi:hypothetical protein
VAIEHVPQVVQTFGHFMQSSALLWAFFNVYAKEASGERTIKPQN